MQTVPPAPVNVAAETEAEAASISVPTESALSAVSILLATVSKSDWEPVSTLEDMVTVADTPVMAHSPEVRVPRVIVAPDTSETELIAPSIADLEAAQLSLVEASTAFIPVMVKAAVPEAYSQVWPAASQSAAVPQAVGVVAQAVGVGVPIVPVEPTQ